MMEFVGKRVFGVTSICTVFGILISWKKQIKHPSCVQLEEVRFASYANSRQTEIINIFFTDVFFNRL